METQIGRYEVERLLGKGAMGNVYLAFDPVIERHVAIKTIRVDHLEAEQEQAEFSRRFFQEARICGRLQHPGVVTIHDLGRHQNEPFLVMEYVEGEDLAQRLRKQPNLSRDQVIQIISAIADTLDAAHALQIIHRDIKPQNIMLPNNGGIKILDFGIAKVAGMEQTLNGAYWGTPAYSSPEQITERKVDHRTDLYAFGLVVHKLLTLYEPFSAENIKKLFYQILYEPPRLRSPLPEYGLAVAPLQQILLKALDKDPDRRYQRAAYFKEELLALFQAPPSQEMLGSDHTAPLVEDISGSYETQTLATTAPVSQSQRLERLRQRFQESLDQGNLTACKLLLRTMERKHWEVEAERRLLEEALANQTQARQAAIEEQAEGPRKRFRLLMEKGDLASAEKELGLLRALEVDVAAETAQWDAAEQARLKQLVMEQVRFDQALSERKLVDARASLVAMKKLGGDTKAADRQLQTMEHQVRIQKGERLSELGAVRNRFKSALAFEDLEEAEQAFQELRRLGAPSTSEEMELITLTRAWASQDPSRREGLINGLQGKLRAGLLDSLAGDLSRLERLADPRDESLRSTWATRFAKAQSQNNERTRRTLEEKIETALAEGDVLHSQELLRQLKVIDPLSPMLAWLEKKAAGEEPGPRPTTSFQFKLWMVWVLVVGLASAWLLYNALT